VYRVVDEDKRITTLMEEIRGQVLAREQARVATSASGKDTFEPGSSARIAGLRVFRRWGDKSFFTMSSQVRLLMNWGFKPRFYVVEGVRDIPQGYTLVIGADLSTSLTIHEKRATYDGTDSTSEIRALARCDKDADYTGWGPVKVPCTLVRTDALESP
jgi:hypothetical protein